jgi:transposase-like protein
MLIVDYNKMMNQPTIQKGRTKAKRARYTFATKVEVLTKLKEVGANISKVSRATGVNYSTVKSWKDNEEKIWSAAEAGADNAATSKYRRQRTMPYDEMYDELGRAVRQLKYFGDDEIAAFQGLFMLSPRKHEKLVERLSTKQKGILLCMARDSVRVHEKEVAMSQSSKVVRDFSFLICILQEKNVA